MTNTPTAELPISPPLPSIPPLLSVPAFWPMALAKEAPDAILKNLKFADEEIKIHAELRPKLATPNIVRLDLRTMVLRDYGRPDGIPTLVHAPYSGQSAVIADFDKGQSLVETLLANGIGHVALTDWKSATDDMKDFDIDSYLAELIVAIDDLGGRVNLVGLSQGGWQSAMAAARFPEKVNTLVLAGAPIDTDAGDLPVTHMAHLSPMKFYEDLVTLGGGLMRGKFMLRGWKNMHPEEHYIKEHIDLLMNIDDPAYVAKRETFESWYENPLDLPGRWYLQVMRRDLQGEPARQGRVRRPRPPAEPQGDRLPCLSAGRRERRHHEPGASVRRGKISRNAKRANREETGRGRPHRPVHGVADAEGDVAFDRAVDQGAGAA